MAKEYKYADPADIHNAYVYLEDYLHEITGLPEHVGVMGLFGSILRGKYKVIFKQISKFRNTNDGHGIRVEGEEPTGPQSWVTFLEDELAWAKRNEERVKKQMLEANKKRLEHMVNNAKEQLEADKPLEKPKKPLTPTAKLLITSGIITFAICLSALILWLCNVPIENLIVKSLISVGALAIFAGSTLIANWFNKKGIAINYKLGTILLCVALLLNVLLTILFKADFDFSSIWIFVITILFGGLCAKTSFEDEETSWGVVNVLEVLTAIAGIVFVVIYALNGWVNDWTLSQFVIAISVCLVLTLFAVIIPNFNSFLSESYTGEIMLGLVTVANFVLALIFRENYQFVFYFITAFSVIYGILLTVSRGNSIFGSEIKTVDIIETIASVIFLIIFFLV